MDHRKSALIGFQNIPLSELLQQRKQEEESVKRHSTYFKPVTHRG